MKRIAAFLGAVFSALSCFGQAGITVNTGSGVITAPPAVTGTNFGNANKIPQASASTSTGVVPVWNGTSWIPTSTNGFGGGGSATNAVSTIKTNSVTVATGVTTLNFSNVAASVSGSTVNISPSATATSGGFTLSTTTPILGTTNVSGSQTNVALTLDTNKLLSINSNTLAITSTGGATQFKIANGIPSSVVGGGISNFNAFIGNDVYFGRASNRIGGFIEYSKTPTSSMMTSNYTITGTTSYGSGGSHTQGITYDSVNDGFIVPYSTAIFKFANDIHWSNNTTLTLVASNTTALGTTLPSGSHYGAGSIANGIFYVAVETFTSVTVYSDQQIATFDAKTLAYLGTFPANDFNMEISGATFVRSQGTNLDGTGNGLIFCSSYTNPPVNPVIRVYDGLSHQCLGVMNTGIEDFTPVYGQAPTLSLCQDMMWHPPSSSFFCSVDVNPVFVFQMDLQGNLYQWPLNTIISTSATTEGIGFNGTTFYIANNASTIWVCTFNVTPTITADGLGNLTVKSNVIGNIILGNSAVFTNGSSNLGPMLITHLPSTSAVGMLGLDASGNVVSNAIPSGSLPTFNGLQFFSVSGGNTNLQTNQTLNSVVVTGNITNQSLTASQLIGTDANKAETTVTVGTGLSLSAGTLTATGASTTLSNLYLSFSNSTLPVNTLFTNSTGVPIINTGQIWAVNSVTLGGVSVAVVYTNNDGAGWQTNANLLRTTGVLESNSITYAVPLATNAVWAISNYSGSSAVILIGNTHVTAWNGGGGTNVTSGSGGSSFTNSLGQVTNTFYIATGLPTAQAAVTNTQVITGGSGSFKILPGQSNVMTLHVVGPTNGGQVFRTTIMRGNGTSNDNFQIDSQTGDVTASSNVFGNNITATNVIQGASLTNGVNSGVNAAGLLTAVTGKFGTLQTNGMPVELVNIITHMRSTPVIATNTGAGTLSGFNQSALLPGFNDYQMIVALTNGGSATASSGQLFNITYGTPFSNPVAVSFTPYEAMAAFTMNINKFITISNATATGFTVNWSATSQETLAGSAIVKMMFTVGTAP